MNCPHCQAPVHESQPFCGKCGGVLAKPASEDPLVGQIFAGRYRIVKLLGEGGMGSVYLAEQNLGSSVRKVAIKTLHAHLSQDEAIRARFQREVGTVAELEHPNTIQVFDFGTSPDGHLFIVMEFVQGVSLGDALTREKHFSPERTKKILAQVVGALAEAHQRGIVHRDLKPDNVILTKRAGQEDFVKLLDFGIAKRSTQSSAAEAKLTQQGTVLGTPPYMSPEQFTGNAVDARSDIYALAVMAYEMLTGELPFKANTAWEWATQHMRVAPRPIEGAPFGEAVPRPMRKAIERALAKSPDDRPATVTAFFEAFAEGRVTDPAAPLASVAAPALITPLASTQPRGTEPGEPVYVPPQPSVYGAHSAGPYGGAPAPYAAAGGALGAVGSVAPATPVGSLGAVAAAGGTMPGTPLAQLPYAAPAVPAGPGTYVPPPGGYVPPGHLATTAAGSLTAPARGNPDQRRRGNGLLIGAGVIALLSVTAIVVAATGVADGVFSGRTPTPIAPIPTTPVATAALTDTTTTTTEAPHAPLGPSTLPAAPQPAYVPPARPTGSVKPQPSTPPSGPPPQPQPTPSQQPPPQPTAPFPFPFPFPPAPQPTTPPQPTAPPIPTPIPTNPSPSPAVGKKCEEAKAMPPGPKRDWAISRFCQ